MLLSIRRPKNIQSSATDLWLNQRFSHPRRQIPLDDIGSEEMVMITNYGDRMCSIGDDYYSEDMELLYK